MASYSTCAALLDHPPSLCGGGRVIIAAAVAAGTGRAAPALRAPACSGGRCAGTRRGAAAPGSSAPRPAMASSDMRTAFVGAARRRHVGVVAADRSADVALRRHDVIGRVEPDPAEAGQIGLDPGMARILARAILALAAVMQIARHIARRHAPASRHRDHDVGEVLAHPAPGLERVVDRRMDLGDAHLIVEGAMERPVEMTQRAQRVAAGFLDALGRHEFAQGCAHAGEFGVLHQVELIGGEVERVVAAPFQVIDALGRLETVGHLDDRLHLDAQLAVLAQHIEVIDRVAQVVAIGIELGARIGR